MAPSTKTFLSSSTLSATLTTHPQVPGHFPRNPDTLLVPNAHISLAVDEYVVTPLSSVHSNRDEGLTLIFTHGTSFNKVLWRPMIVRLLQNIDAENAKSRKSLEVRRILAVDASNHGESWINNKKALRGVSHWPDQSRDILSVLKHFKVRQPVVGIGHSFGGGIMAHAALMSPSSFVATVFVDPILFRMAAQDKLTADRALRRRDTWDNVDQVRTLFGENKGFTNWHREVLGLHVDHSTVDAGSSRVLATPKEQEAATYLAGPLEQLPTLLSKSHAQHFFILGKESIVIPKNDREWIQKTWSGVNQTVVMEEAGHLIPMQDPDGLARNLYLILNETWRNVDGSHVHSSL